MQDMDLEDGEDELENRKDEHEGEALSQETKYSIYKLYRGQTPVP